jgi:type II secretory pathway predicted ATPase ExeA
LLAGGIAATTAYATCIVVVCLLLIGLYRTTAKKNEKITSRAHGTLGVGIGFAVRPVHSSQSTGASWAQANPAPRFKGATADAFGDVRPAELGLRRSAASKSYYASSEGQAQLAMLPPIGVPNDGHEESAAAPASECNSMNLGGESLGFLLPLPRERMFPIVSYTAADEGVQAFLQATEDAEIVSVSVAEDAAAEPNGSRNQDAAGYMELAPVALAEENVPDFNGFAMEESIAIVEIAVAPVEDTAAEISCLPVHRVVEDVEIAPAPVAAESTEELDSAHVQAVAETENPQSFTVGDVRTEPSTPEFGFLNFYGLNEQPFDVTPDPAYLYLSPMHGEALSSLSQGIQNLRGFMALVAEPGMGKTTLLNRLMEELHETARTVFLFQTQCNSRELLRYLLGELGVESESMDVVSMHRALNEILFQEMLNGRRFVLIIDEAQNLDASTLETIRLLSDFETSHAKLIQIVLAGQPQLIETLLRPNLSQLRQRIAILTNLEPLCASETSQYIEHRLRAAGSPDGAIFTPEAMALIAEHSHGIPRSINNLCFNALQMGYSKECDTIDAGIVQAVAEKLDLEALLGHPQEAAGTQDAAAATQSPSTQLAQLLLDALTGAQQAAQRPSNGNHAKTAMALTGRLTEKLKSRSWGKECEFRIQVSLERQGTAEIPVADRYYCCSIYVSEEQAKYLEAGKPVKITIEQD